MKLFIWFGFIGKVYGFENWAWTDFNVLLQ